MQPIEKPFVLPVPEFQIQNSVPDFPDFHIPVCVFAFVFASNLIKPLVFRIKGGHGDVDDFHPANGAVTTTGLNQNRCQGFDWYARAIEFDEAVTVGLQDQVNLRQLLMIVRAGVDADVEVVNCRNRIVGRAERAPCLPARTGLRRD